MNQEQSESHADRFVSLDRRLAAIKSEKQANVFIEKFYKENQSIFEEREILHIEKYDWRSFSNYFPRKIDCILGFVIFIIILFTATFFLYLEYSGEGVFDSSIVTVLFLFLIPVSMFFAHERMNDWRNFDGDKSLLKGKLDQASLDPQTLANLLESYAIIKWERKHGGRSFGSSSLGGGGGG